MKIGFKNMAILASMLAFSDYGSKLDLKTGKGSKGTRHFQRANFKRRKAAKAARIARRISRPTY